MNIVLQSKYTTNCLTKQKYVSGIGYIIISSPIATVNLLINLLTRYLLQQPLYHIARSFIVLITGREPAVGVFIV